MPTGHWAPGSSGPCEVRMIASRSTRSSSARVMSVLSGSTLGSIQSHVLSRLAPIRSARKWHPGSRQSSICTSRRYATGKRVTRDFSPSVASTWLTDTPQLVVSLRILTSRKFSPNSSPEAGRHPIDRSSATASLRCSELRSYTSSHFQFCSLA